MKNAFRQSINGFAVVAGVCATSIGSVAIAATDTSTFDVTAQVAAACSIVSTETVAFGTYDATLGNTATATITTNCTLATTYSLALDGGSSGDSSARVMDLSGGTGTADQKLSYQLYSDAPGGTVWGDGLNGTAAKTGLIGTGLNDVTNIVYGQIPSGQNKETGSYSDTITVTLTY